MNDPVGHDTAASSFTDLMASLMVIFVLLFVVQLNNASAKGRTAKDDILADLRRQLHQAGLGAEVREDERDRDAIVIIMSDSLLFARGATEINEGGKSALRTLVPIIGAVVCEETTRRSIQTIVVEGHTDSTWAGTRSGPVGMEDARELNLELSQGRSMAVVKQSLEALQDPTRTCIRSLMSASGRGQEELLGGLRGDDARQRRVVFKIRVVTNLAEAISGSIDSTAEVRVELQP